MARTTRRGAWWLYDDYRNLKWVDSARQADRGGKPRGRRSSYRLRDGASTWATCYVGYHFKRELITDGVSTHEGLRCACCSADTPRSRGHKRRVADRWAIREGLHDYAGGDGVTHRCAYLPPTHRRWRRARYRRWRSRARSRRPSAPTARTTASRSANAVEAPRRRLSVAVAQSVFERPEGSGDLGGDGGALRMPRPPWSAFGTNDTEKT